jgi:hypothetical protein
LPQKQKNSNFDNKISWSTLLKAFLRSQNRPQTNFLELKASIISLIKLKVAALVDDLGLKPNYSSTNILLLLLLSKCWYILTYWTVSNTLEDAGKRDMGL